MLRNLLRSMHDFRIAVIIGLAILLVLFGLPVLAQFEEVINGNNLPVSEPLININTRFFYNIGINLAAVLVIILFLYYPNYKKLDTIFTFIIFNIVIFLLTFVLNKVRISMGAAFGLFAVFSMLRYRTEGIDPKDMTYLFIFIALGLISGIQLDMEVLLVIVAIIVAAAFILDSRLVMKRESCQLVQYERVDLIKPALRQELLDDLKNRTGLNIHRISIMKLDYLNDSALIRVYYYEEP